MDTERHSLADVSVSFRDCLPCEQTISSFRDMALDAAARQLVVQVRMRTSHYELGAFMSDGTRTGTFRAVGDSLGAAVERIRRQVASWRDASGPIRTDGPLLRTVHATRDSARGSCRFGPFTYRGDALRLLRGREFAG